MTLQRMRQIEETFLKLLIVILHNMECQLSRDEATEAVRKIIDNLWKMMNEDMMKPTTIPRILIMYAFNFARLAHIFCYHKDWYTYAHNMEPLAMSLFVNPLPM